MEIIVILIAIISVLLIIGIIIGIDLTIKSDNLMESSLILLLLIVVIICGGVYLNILSKLFINEIVINVS